MAKLFNRFGTSNALKKIILEADKQLILISPYIKLNTEIKEALSTHLTHLKVAITVVYGKNEENKQKSISSEDYTFLKSFPNISIRYHKRLHAKLYANHRQCLVTSLNLHNYSLRENIEVGILTEFKILDLAGGLLNKLAPTLFSKSLDAQAIDFIRYIINKSHIEFEKKPKKKTAVFRLFTTYEKPEVTIEKIRTGYCIRYRDVIPFNIHKPYSQRAFEVWEKYNNKNYQERYCHGCGKENASTSSTPLCSDCYENLMK